MSCDQRSLDLSALCTVSCCPEHLWISVLSNVSCDQNISGSLCATYHVLWPERLWISVCYVPCLVTVWPEYLWISVLRNVSCDQNICGSLRATYRVLWPERLWISVLRTVSCDQRIMSDQNIFGSLCYVPCLVTRSLTRTSLDLRVWGPELLWICAPRHVPFLVDQRTSPACPEDLRSGLAAHAALEVRRLAEAKQLADEAALESRRARRRRRRPHRKWCRHRGHRRRRRRRGRGRRGAGSWNGTKHNAMIRDR